MFEMDLRARFEFDVYILVELYGVVVRVVFEMRVVVMVMVMRVRRVPEDIGFVMMDFDGKFALCLVQEGCQTVGVVNAIELNPFLRCQFDLKSGTTREKKEIKQIIRGGMRLCHTPFLRILLLFDDPARNFGCLSAVESGPLRVCDCCC